MAKTTWSFLRNLSVPLLICAIAFGAISASAFFVKKLLHEEAEVLCRGEARVIKARIQEHLANYFTLVYASQAFLAASDDVQPEDWAQFIQLQMQPWSHAGFLNAAFVERVERISGLESFEIRYFEPSKGIESEIGRDLTFDPVRIKAMRRALETGKPSITGPLFEKTPMLIMYLPAQVKRIDTSTALIQLEGLVAFRINSQFFFQEILEPTGNHSDVEIFDLDENKEALLYDEDQVAGEKENAESWMKIEELLEYGGRRWVIRFYSNPSMHIGKTEKLLPNLILLLGTAFVVLLFGFLYSLATSKIRAERRALDMTKSLRTSELQIRESEERYRTIVETSNEVIWTTDCNGTISFINPACSRLYGYEPVEMIGTPLPNLIKEENRQGWQRVFSRILEAGGAVRFFECMHQRKDGTYIPVSMNAIPVKDKTGKVVSISGTIADLAERRLIEEERLKASKLESLGQLAGGIAHDFNNLLAGVMMNLSLARMLSAGNEKVVERMEDGERALLRARDLTQQLLTFSKGGTPILKTSNILPLIKDTAELSLRGTSASFLIQGTELWPVDIDEGQLRQVLHNIISNAQQAMPYGGQVEIIVTNEQIDSNSSDAGPILVPGRYVKISIQDPGIGIPSENLPRIFDPYFTTKEKRSGLGLASAYSIIRNHNGAISVQSREGSGSTFNIYLPASIKAVSEKPKKEERKIRARILIMDDEPTIRSALKEVLTLAGYYADTAENGEIALSLYQDALAKKEPYDLVILDLTIPGGMGGQETITRMREIDPDVKAIVSSGYSNDPIMAEYRKYGFKAVIAKPYKIADLRKVIDEMLSTN